MEDERVVYKPVTGWPQQAVSEVLRKISAYTRRDRVRGFKIGITNNPDRRFYDGYAHAYHKMVVVYESSSLDNVSELERLLIEYNRELADNIISGGGGNYGEPPYYLYVVMR